jgi:hypothetical protein
MLDQPSSSGLYAQASAQSQHSRSYTNGGSQGSYVRFVRPSIIATSARPAFARLAINESGGGEEGARLPLPLLDSFLCDALQRPEPPESYHQFLVGLVPPCAQFPRPDLGARRFSPPAPIGTCRRC